MWETYLISEQANISPSEILGIDRKQFPWRAFILDRAVVSFGNALQGDLDSAEGKNAREIEVSRRRILARWFPEHKSQMYADPAVQSY